MRFPPLLRNRGARHVRAWTPLDLAIGASLLAVVGFVVHRVHADLQYDWDWGAVAGYLVRRDRETGGWVPNLLLQGLLTTVRLSIWGTLLASLIGLAMGLARVSRSLFWRLVGTTYVGVVRNLPPLVLILIGYFFLGDQILSGLGIDQWVREASPAVQGWVTALAAPPSLLTPFLSALLTLALFEGAYFAEIFRAGIVSVEAGQWEAASALGLNPWQRMSHVVLPQALRRSLPALAGQFISTIKDSAIVSVISIQELTFQGMEVVATTYRTFEVWITVTALYFVLTFTLSLAVHRLEARLAQADA